MKTKEQIQKLIEEKQKELDQLKQELQTAKSPKEAWGDEYGIKQEKCHFIDTWEIAAENEKDSQLTGNQYDLMRELQTFAKRRNGDWEADWGDGREKKYGIKLYKGKAINTTLCHYNTFIYGISFESREIAQEALEIFGQRIEQFYGK